MAFSKKTWVDRLSEFPTRRTLTAVAGVADTYAVTRAEGTVTTAGDTFSAATMNDLEDRIAGAVAGTVVSATLSATWSTASAGTTPSTTYCDHYQSVTANGVTSSNNIQVGLAATATAAERLAAGKAKLFCYSQTTNSIVVCVADGATKPTITIPITVLILG